MLLCDDVAVPTMYRTSHVLHCSPLGGAVTMRTHLSLFPLFISRLSSMITVTINYLSRSQQEKYTFIYQKHPLVS